MKVAVLVISRGTERKDFLAFAKKQISQQTRQPDKLLVIDYPPMNEKPDITARYKIGYDLLSQEGFDVIIPWEDDDYYVTTYIEIMTERYEASGKPDIFGIHNTTYYHLFSQIFTHIKHPGRASMCCTLLKGGLTIKWAHPEYKFADLTLWQQLKGITIPAKDLHLGIKHGIGLSGGVGHNKDFFQLSSNEVSARDTDFDFLRAHTTKEAYTFYQKIITAKNKNGRNS